MIFDKDLMPVIFAVIFLAIFLWTLISLRAGRRHLPQDSDEITKMLIREKAETARLWNSVAAAMAAAVSEREENYRLERELFHEFLTETSAELVSNPNYKLDKPITKEFCFTVSESLKSGELERLTDKQAIIVATAQLAMTTLQKMAILCLLVRAQRIHDLNQGLRLVSGSVMIAFDKGSLDCDLAVKALEAAEKGELDPPKGVNGNEVVTTAGSEEVRREGATWIT